MMQPPLDRRNLVQPDHPALGSNFPLLIVKGAYSSVYIVGQHISILARTCNTESTGERLRHSPGIISLSC